MTAAEVAVVTIRRGEDGTWLLEACLDPWLLVMDPHEAARILEAAAAALVADAEVLAAEPARGGPRLRLVSDPPGEAEELDP